MVSSTDLRDDLDSKKWVIVQLTPTGERETRIPVLKRSVHKLLKQELDVFVPAISQQVREDSQTIAFMEGYVFVEYEPGISYLKLQETTFFSVVLCNSQRGDGLPQYSLLDDSQLDPLRKGMDDLKYGDFQVGDKVRVAKGSYKNLIGRVTLVLDDGKNVQVSADLRSKHLLMEFPTIYLARVDE
jgi:transcription antitermination factor NusG